MNSCIFAGGIKAQYSLRLISAGILLALTGNAYAAPETCPQVSNITATKINAEKGYTYAAPSIRGGWKGENPEAKESYLDKVEFVSAVIRKAQDGVYYVACDYEGEGIAGVRMSQRFPERPTPASAWKVEDCLNAALGACIFEVVAN